MGVFNAFQILLNLLEKKCFIIFIYEVSTAKNVWNDFKISEKVTFDLLFDAEKMTLDAWLPPKALLGRSAKLRMFGVSLKLM